MGRHREFKEEDVVQKAMLAFWKTGWRDTTPQHLIDVTGLSRSSLYATFGSKQGVFLAAFLANIISGSLGYTWFRMAMQPYLKEEPETETA